MDENKNLKVRTTKMLLDSGASVSRDSYVKTSLFLS